MHCRYRIWVPLEEFPVEVLKGGDDDYGRLVGLVGERDRNYLVSNAEQQASGIANINQALLKSSPTAPL